jgi:maltose alpha-D-glucosyltransferase/alpha-amylase
VLHRFIPNQGNAWQYMLHQLSHYFERVAALAREESLRPPPPGALVEATESDPQPRQWQSLLGPHQETAWLLGQRTAEFHQAMAASRSDPLLAPASFGKLHQRSLYQSMRNLTGRLCGRLPRHYVDLPESARALAHQIVAKHDLILKRFHVILDPAFDSQCIRCHGDYTLEQLLFTGKDFVIMDFEGDTARTIGQRRVKRSPLWDVTSMIRSFDDAVQSVFLGLSDNRGRPPGMIRPEDQSTLEPWATAWFEQVVQSFVLSYLQMIRPADLLPAAQSSCFMLLELFLLEKALLEIDADVSVRPEWVVIPMRSAARLLDQDPAGSGLCF